MSGLWPHTLAAGALFSAGFFLMLPLALPEAYRAASAALLGCASALLLIHKQKQMHLDRHVREASFLGFRCRVEGSLWNPAGAPELLLDKPMGDPEEDRLLYCLVLMHGPDYGLTPFVLSWTGCWAAAAAALIAAAMGAFHGSAPALLPLFGLVSLVFLAGKAETLLARAERGSTEHEMQAHASPESDYNQWNFLALEAKRVRTGRLPAMERDFRKVLSERAGLEPGARVLEVGAGGGFLWRHSPPELRPGWTQAEKDHLPALYARRHCPGASLCLADVKKLPQADSSQDAVVGLECFDSLSPYDLTGLVGEAFRVLKPGGRLVHLKDFPDWPGQRLADIFNDFSMKAVRVPAVKMNPRLRLEFEALSPASVATLRKAAAGEAGLAGVYAEVLADIYEAGPLSDARFSVPMFVSALVLRRVFLSAGFEPVSDSLGAAGRLAEVIAYIVVRKPAVAGA